MRRPLIAGVCLALAVAAAGCGKAEEQNSSSGGGGGSNGPGVTDKTITLGALMDLTNVFAAGSKGILEGTNLYWDSVNADGGPLPERLEVAASSNRGFAAIAGTCWSSAILP